ncbi:hypothetical protein ZOSMA_202G00550, partial [Zostera marina]
MNYAKSGMLEKCHANQSNANNVEIDIAPSTCENESNNKSKSVHYIL